MEISVTRSSICGLVRFHNYNVNKRFCHYLDLALQHLKVSLYRSVICLDRGNFKLFYFLEHLRSLLQIYVIYLLYMNYAGPAEPVGPKIFSFMVKALYFQSSGRTNDFRIEVFSNGRTNLLVLLPTPLLRAVSKICYMGFIQHSES